MLVIKGNNKNRGIIKGNMRDNKRGYNRKLIIGVNNRGFVILGR